MGRGKSYFLQVDQFYKVFTNLQDAFYRFKRFELVFEMVKVGPHNRFPMGRES